MASDATAYKLGPIEGSPWLRLSLLGDGLELTCEVCRYSGSASAKALEKDPGVIERAAAWHAKCGGEQ